MMPGRRSPLHHHFSLVLAPALLAGIGLCSTALAQRSTPGEKWRVSVASEGMGMPMPGMTQEACLPIEKPEETLRQPGDDVAACRVLDLSQSGNRTSGRMECKDDESSFSATFETTTERNRIRSVISLVRPEGRMTIKQEAVRLGAPCTAQVYDAAAAKAQAQARTDEERKARAAYAAATCGKAAEALRQNPREVGQHAELFLGRDGLCGQVRPGSDFCGAVAAPAGFLELRRISDLHRAGSGSDPRAAYLRQAAAACGMGSDVTALTAQFQRAMDHFRQLFAGGSRASDTVNSLLTQGNDADYQTVRAAALKQCQGTLYTSRHGQELFDFCARFGPSLARDDREAAQVSAGGVPGSSAAPGAAASSVLLPRPPGIAASQAGGRQPSRNASLPPGTAASQPGSPPAPALGDLLRRGRGLLEGVLGR